MANVSYQVGDVIEQSLGRESRFVRVEDREADIKNDRPGFGGQQCTENGAALPPNPPFGNGVWGYDHQVARVVSTG